MKNKTITYGLLVVVLIIWGGIFYRIFISFFPADKPIAKNEQKFTIESVSGFEEAQSFALRSGYRDPFLGDTHTSDFSEENKPVKKILKKVSVEPSIDWSFVKYLGLIKNSGNTRKLAMVTIHGMEYMLSEGEEMSSVKCLKNNKDSILISYQGKVKWIKK
jgi:hypothetical protein